MLLDDVDDTYPVGLSTDKLTREREEKGGKYAETESVSDYTVNVPPCHDDDDNYGDATAPAHCCC